MLHQPRAAPPDTSPHLIGAPREAIYKTDMGSGPQRLKDGADAGLTAAPLLDAVGAEADGRGGKVTTPV